MGWGLTLGLPCEIEDERSVEVAHGNQTSSYPHCILSWLLQVVTVQPTVHADIWDKADASSQKCRSGATKTW